MRLILRARGHYEISAAARPTRHCLEMPWLIAFGVEGEEEIGSVNLADVVRLPEVTRQLQRCMGIFSCTAAQSPDGEVTIDLGAKGVLEVALVASGAAWGRGPREDIHSGYAAYVDSPLRHLIKALSTLTSTDGTAVSIDGRFDNVIPLTERQKVLIAKQAKCRRRAEREEAARCRAVDEQYELCRGARKTGDGANRQYRGYRRRLWGAGGKTILPAGAVAKLDFRLVPNQSAEDCTAKLKRHLAARGFGDVEVKAVATAYDHMSVPYAPNPCNPTSGPGYLFARPPLKLDWADIGLGHGARLHAPDEYYVIESNDPRLNARLGDTE